ncbi:MAG: SIMPL domain-containing protein [Alistipes sp.]|nr:SIMPL domain-containing protein [Alistipes sp.]MBR3847405.1 SIMPL domain-containing protein [Alistipes sp.]MBR7169857.1 SIMPL domain-containing protein [Alistipes sp.]
MKKMMLVLAALVVVAASASAQQTEAFPSYIEVTGVAEKEVAPNEIYLSITINERDSKGKISVDEQQREMLAALKKLGVKPDSQLKMVDLTSSYFKRGNALAKAQYELKLGSAVEVAKVWRALDGLGISQVTVTKVSHTDLEKFKAETRTEAIRAARDNARALAEAIDQKAGKCFWIADYSSPVRTVYAAANLKSRAMVEEASFDAVVEEEGLEFQTINLQHRVQAKFVLE